MRIVDHLPHKPRPDAWYKVYTSDVSRMGFSFLHSEQLFPREQLELVISGSLHYIGEVRRCRRVNPQCYLVGAQFCV
jgi:hypothetical protein